MDDKNNLVEQLRAQAKAYLPSRLQTLALRYGFTLRRVAVKHNRSNWGSCSSLGNVNLNLNLVRLPVVLSDYVMIHELCHLKYMNHSRRFHILLEKYCRDDYERLLSEGDASPLSVSEKIRRSKARFPVSFTLRRALREWKLV